MKIWAHTIVKNEGRCLWFSVGSIVNWVDKVLLWDTGSTDDTPRIAYELSKKFPGKIDYRELGDVDVNGFTEARNKMLEATKADWFLIVDGDEVWWDEAIRGIEEVIRNKGKVLDSIGCRYYNLVGDMFHYQDESAGRYHIDGRVGHLTLRAFNTDIPGLHFGKPHGQQGLFDKNETLVQDLPIKRRSFIYDQAYLHFTHLPRSSRFMDFSVPKRAMKLKYERGNKFPLDFYYPEVFFRSKPNIIPSPWEVVSNEFLVKSFILTPLRKIKRKFGSKSSGY